MVVYANSLRIVPRLRLTAIIIPMSARDAYSPQVPRERVRNFSIVAHIDHGKSTISDRILEATHTLEDREMTSQVLDTMDIERERGITIKSNAVRLFYEADDGEVYALNLIDTPGHVDFSYEVSRSLAACEGAVLVVDATQGVEAQTVSNALLAMNANLEIVVAINKIDLPSAEPERIKEEVEDVLALPADDAVLVSGKTGEGIHDLLEAIVALIPPPEGDDGDPLAALVVDSWFDAYRGVVAIVRVMDGEIRARDQLLLMASKAPFDAEEVGYRQPREVPLRRLGAGEVGYVVTGLKDAALVHAGDTITSREGGATEALGGYREAKPMVFCGLFPTDTNDFEALRDALERLTLNDPSITWEPENSVALGFGFRVGFLGLLHMEVVKERLEREFDLDLVATAPSVDYHVHTTKGTVLDVKSPKDLPDPSSIAFIEEPILKATVIVPPDYVGAVMELTTEHRGTFENMVYLSERSVEMHWKVPLSELILDYFDQLKSRTKGYASLDYDLTGYAEADLVKLDILLAGDPVDALSFIVPRERAQAMGHDLAVKLKEIIPRQLFEVPIQAVVGSRVVARTNVKARRKDVLAKCYGGDISRKRKLLEKQREGKKRMKSIGKVDVPQEAFMAILKVGE